MHLSGFQLLALDSSLRTKPFRTGVTTNDENRLINLQLLVRKIYFRLKPSSLYEYILMESFKSLNSAFTLKDSMSNSEYEDTSPLEKNLATSLSAEHGSPILSWLLTWQRLNA